MRPKRSTTTTGGSRGGCDDGVGDNDGNPCQPDGEMDESIVLDTKTLLEMLGPSNPAAAEEEDGEEDGEDEDEKLDLVMDLKRKFSTCVLMMSGGGMLHDDTGGSSGANGGDGSAQTRDSSSSSSSSSSGGGVVVSLPGASDNNVAVFGPFFILPLSVTAAVCVGWFTKRKGVPICQGRTIAISFVWRASGMYC